MKLSLKILLFGIANFVVGAIHGALRNQIFFIFVLLFMIIMGVLSVEIAKKYEEP